MQEQKKEKLKILVIDWLIILGVYLFVRLMFIMFGYWKSFPAPEWNRAF